MNPNVHKLPKELLKLFYDLIDCKTNKKLDITDVAWLTGEVLTVLTTKYQQERRIRIQQKAMANTMHDSLWASEE